MNPSPPPGSPVPGPIPRWRWLRLSLRATMTLILLAGGVAGWMAHVIRTQRSAVATVRAAGGAIGFDYETQPVGTDALGQPIYRTEPRAPRWLRGFLGDELFRSARAVSFPQPVTAEALAAVARFDRLETFELPNSFGVGAGFGHLRGLGRLREVRTGGLGVTDDALAALGGVSSLRQLQIGGTRATDAGFAALAALPRLESLRIAYAPCLTDAGAARLVAGLPALRDLKLAGDPRPLAATLAALATHHPALRALDLGKSQVTDADLARVARLSQLEELELPQTPVTDAGLVALKSLGKLLKLDIRQTEVTAEGVARLQATLPTLATVQHARFFPAVRRQQLKSVGTLPNLPFVRLITPLPPPAEAPR